MAEVPKVNHDAPKEGHKGKGPGTSPELANGNQAHPLPHDHAKDLATERAAGVPPAESVFSQGDGTPRGSRAQIEGATKPLDNSWEDAKSSARDAGKLAQAAPEAEPADAKLQKEMDARLLSAGIPASTAKTLRERGLSEEQLALVAKSGMNDQLIQQMLRSGSPMEQLELSARLGATADPTRRVETNARAKDVALALADAKPDAIRSLLPKMEEDINDTRVRVAAIEGKLAKALEAAQMS